MKAIIMIAVLAAASTQMASAQDAVQTATMLAERIADSGSGAKVTVGALPPGWIPPVELPKSAAMLGSVANQSTRTVTVYYVTLNVRELYNAYVAGLKGNGFSSLNESAQARGFATSANGDIPTYTTLCRGTSTIEITVPLNRSDDLRVSVGEAPQGCRPGLAALAAVTNPLPSFVAPQGTTVVPITSSFTPAMYGPGTKASVVTAATISGNVSASAILDSLETQLRAAGWRINSTVVQPNGGVEVLELGSGATMWHGALMLYPGERPATFVARIDATGGTLTPEQVVTAQRSQLPQVAQTVRTSDEPALVRLMRRMFSEYAADMPQTVYIKRVPPALNKGIPLPKTAPLGSVAVGGFTSPMIANAEFTLYYELNRAQLQSYYARLQSGGWSTIILPDIAGGFHMPERAQIAGFCKPNLPSVMIQLGPSSKDVTISMQHGACGRGAMQKAVAQVEAQIGPMPAISAPAGVTMSAGQPGIPGGVSGAEFRGANSLSQLLDFFGSQLVAAGWKAGAASANTRIGSRTFTTSASGHLWQAVITVYASPARAKTYFGFIDLTNVH